MGIPCGFILYGIGKVDGGAAVTAYTHSLSHPLLDTASRVVTDSCLVDNGPSGAPANLDSTA